MEEGQDQFVERRVGRARQTPTVTFVGSVVLATLLQQHCMVGSRHLPGNNFPRALLPHFCMENWLPQGNEVITCDIEGAATSSSIPDGTLSSGICSFHDLHVEQQRGGDDWPKLKVALAKLGLWQQGSLPTFLLSPSSDCGSRVLFLPSYSSSKFRADLTS